MRFHVVSDSFTELLNKRQGMKSVQATIHEYAKGAKNPLATHIIMKHLIKAFAILILLAVIVSLLLLRVELLDNTILWLTPTSEKANKAMDIAIERMQTEKGVYEVQRLLNVVEENLNVQGPPHKALRELQEVENKLRIIKQLLEEQKTESEEYQLVIKHASLRIDILLQEVELAKQKTKVKLD